MNVFLLTETLSGCYNWRAAIPAKYLRRRGHQVQIFDMDGASRYQTPDVMVFYRAHFQESPRIIQWCKKNGIRVVFDTDDALDLVPPENLFYNLVRPRLPLYETLLESADVVTTTTETLAAHLRQSNPNVVVVPNSVDPEEWSTMPKTGQAASGPVRVGWTGSPTHFADLAIALDAVRELQKKHDFLLVLQGLCEQPSLEQFHSDLLSSTASDSLKLRRAVRSSTSWPSWPECVTNSIPTCWSQSTPRKCAISRSTLGSRRCSTTRSIGTRARSKFTNTPWPAR